MPVPYPCARALRRASSVAAASVAAALIAAVSAPQALAATPAATRTAPTVATPAGQVSHVATTTANATDSTTLSIATPTGTTTGDLLVSRVAARNHPDALTVPQGWSIHRVDQSSWSVKTWVATRAVTSTEPATHTLTLTLDRPANLIGTVSTFRGADLSAPISDSVGSYNSSTRELRVGRGLTATESGALTVWLATQTTGTTLCRNPLAPPSGFVENTESCLPSASAGVSYSVATSPTPAGTAPPANGQSAYTATNTTQALALRAARTSPYAAQPVTVGQLWDGWANDAPNTAIPLSTLNQPSGIAASRRNPGVLYVHSEKRDQTMVAVSARNAEIIGKFTVAIPQVFDWEDIAAGPCPAGTCLFAGDVGTYRGDASKPNNVSAIVRVPEPDVAGGQRSGTLTGERFPFVYPDGAAKDSEAIMVNPWNGRIYVITKTWTGQSEVFVLRANAQPDVVTTVRKVATLTLPVTGGDSASVAITAASIHPWHNTFAVRTYRNIYEFRGEAGAPFPTALAATPAEVTDTAEVQGESLEYATDGSGYFTLSEKVQAPYTLKRVDRRW